MRSNGPFKVYDHAQAKGKQYVANLQQINDQALRRFESEVNGIKELREFQKEQFATSQAHQDAIIASKQELKNTNNINNLEYIQ